MFFSYNQSYKSKNINSRIHLSYKKYWIKKRVTLLAGWETQITVEESSLIARPIFSPSKHRFYISPSIYSMYVWFQWRLFREQRSGFCFFSNQPLHYQKDAESRRRTSFNELHQPLYNKTLRLLISG